MLFLLSIDKLLKLVFGGFGGLGVVAGEATIVFACLSIDSRIDAIFSSARM